MSKIICDGCCVRGSFECRCCGDNARILGERTGLSCECSCRDTEIFLGDWTDDKVVKG